jgi:Xaa-Pro aminopeptidase
MTIDRILDRRGRIRRALAAAGIQGLLVSSPTNVSYLTGFTGDSSVLLVGKDRDLIVSDGRFTTQLAIECPTLEAFIRSPGQELNPAIAHVTRLLGINSLAFEAGILSVADHQVLAAALGTTSMVGVTGWVEELRQIKDELEIAAIREAIGYAERAYAMLRAGLRIGESEKDVADLLESYLRRCGASGSSFPPIVAVGLRSALPHARPVPTTRIGDDDFVLIDWGATGCPYKSDLTRVVVTGKVTARFEAIYRTVLLAQERSIAAIRPGVMAHDIDAIARGVIDEAGFGRFFDHGLGHGIGMDLHEAPRVRKDSRVRLEAGMVITIEPGIYLPEWGGIRIEDDVLVTPDSCEVLSHVPRSLDSVPLN